jgi:Notch-like protein
MAGDWLSLTEPPLLVSTDGFTPLMIASCSGGGLETGNSEEEEDAPAVISDFIYQGASLHNQTDRTGETALHLAARYSRSDAAKRLLEASADANIQDNMGRTPLHAAVSADAQGVFQVGNGCPYRATTLVWGSNLTFVAL